MIKVQVLLQAALASEVQGTGRSRARGPAAVVQGTAAVEHGQLEMVFPSDPSDVLARLISPG